MNRDEFLVIGGIDLGFDINWVDEVICVGISNVYSLVVLGGFGNISFCVFGNYCNVDGIF